MDSPPPECISSLFLGWTVFARKYSRSQRECRFCENGGRLSGDLAPPAAVLVCLELPEIKNVEVVFIRAVLNYDMQFRSAANHFSGFRGSHVLHHTLPVFSTHLLCLFSSSFFFFSFSFLSILPLAAVGTEEFCFEVLLCRYLEEKRGRPLAPTTSAAMLSVS